MAQCLPAGHACPRDMRAAFSRPGRRCGLPPCRSGGRRDRRHLKFSRARPSAHAPGEERQLVGWRRPSAPARGTLVSSCDSTMTIGKRERSTRRRSFRSSLSILLRAGGFFGPDNSEATEKIKPSKAGSRNAMRARPMPAGFAPAMLRVVLGDGCGGSTFCAWWMRARALARHYAVGLWPLSSIASTRSRPLEACGFAC